MAIAFTVISVLGMVVFFTAGAWPVGILFAGLTAIYVSEFFASFRIGARPRPSSPEQTALTNGNTGDALGTSGAVGTATRLAPAVRLAPAGQSVRSPSNPGERALGFFHLATGLWLMYLTFATTLNISLHYALPGG